MTAVAIEKPEPEISEQPSRREKLWRWGAGLSRRSSTLLAAAFYVLGAVYVTARLWADLEHGITTSNEIDYVFFQFVLSHAADAVANLSHPFFSEALNAPHGVNMMANTSMLGISLPLAPVTLLFGPKVSFVITLVIAMAGTATAWYWFMLRHLGTRRSVAFLAAALAGFAPGIVSQSNAHPNIAAQFMLPLIISRLIIMREQPTRAVRHGLILGLLVVYQLFINEEVLLYTAVACAVIALTYAVSRWDEFRGLLKSYAIGIGTGAALACVIMAYPLWFQFFGPQSYEGPFTWAHAYGVDVAAYTAYASESIGGVSNGEHTLAPALAEENAFFGWPICILAVTFAIAYWRVLAVRLAGVAGAVMALLSLGNDIKVNGRLGIPGPWKLIGQLPLFDAIIVTRLALAVAAAVAVIFAVAGNRIVTSLTSLPRSPARSAFTAMAVGLAVLVLLPSAPTPLPSGPRPPSPVFFTEGTWQRYITDGTIVPVPPDTWSMDGPNWMIATKMRARVADGYFLGPTDENNRLATFGGPQRPTGKLLLEVTKPGAGAPLVTEAMKRQALEDIRYWRADILVLGRTDQRDLLRRTVDELLGRMGADVDGVVVWDVRDLR